MPLYEYKCSACSQRFERLERVSASTTRECPSCGATARRQLSPPALQFKGSGWYVTDYARNGSGNGSGGEKPEAKGDAGTGTKSESASETTSESKSSSKESSSSDGSSSHRAA